MRAVLASLLALTACWSDALADSTSSADPNAPINAGVEKVEVTGEGRVAGGAPTSFVTVIRPEEFAGRAVTLADLVGEAPGVHVRQYGGINGFATVMIRGSSADQTIVCVDGIPLNSPLGGAVNLADIPLAGLESIEIHRGFAPASLGASAIGGAINIRTRSPGERHSAGGSLALGSFETGMASGSADWGVGPLRWAGSAESTWTGGDFAYLDNNATDFPTADDRVKRRDNNVSWSSALRLRADAPLPSGRIVSVSTEWLRRRQGVPGIDALESEHATFALQRGLIRAETSWWLRTFGGSELTASLDHEYTSQSFVDPDTPAPQDQTTRVDGTGARLTLVATPTSFQRLSLLLEPRAQTAEALNQLDPTPDPIHARRLSIDAVVEDEIHLAAGRILLAPSMRYDLIDDRSRGGAPGPGAAPPAGISAVSGRLGALLALSSRWSLRGNVGRYYRAPDLIERYGNEGTIAGNPGLLPERGINADLGVGLRVGHLPGSGSGSGADRFRLEAALFRTDADDLIQLVPLPSRVLKAFNIGRARITGLEASASLRLTRGLTASANYTRQKPIILSDTTSYGADLPGRPRVEANTSESLSIGRAAIFHRFSFVGPDSISAVAGLSGGLPSGRAGLTTLPARYLHDAGVRWKMGARLDASVEMDNLLDRRVVDVARYPLPGRTLFVRIATAL